MAKLRIRYFVSRPRKDGTQRHYWQPDEILRTNGWQMTRLSDDKATAMQQAEAKNQDVDLWRANMIDKPINQTPGSINSVIEDYKQSRHYNRLSEKTRKDYDRYLLLISQWAGDQPAVAITAKMVQTLYEAVYKKHPRKAAYIIQVLRLLFSHAERRSMIAKGTNPATNPGLEYKAKKGTRWAPEDILHFVNTADAMDYYPIGTAVMLNEWLGQRRMDLVSFPMKNYRNGRLYITQSKTGAEVELPIDEVPELKQRLDDQLARYRQNKISSTHLIQKQQGRPYTDQGFCSAFDRIRIEAAKIMPHMATLVFKDLRHTAVTRLGEAGATPQQIAAITGHTLKTCVAILDTYNIHTARMASEAFRLRRDAQSTTTKEGEQ